MSSTVTFSGSGQLNGSIVSASIGSATNIIIVGYSSIGGYAFFGRTLITSVTIPSSVTSIGNNAFSSCSGLTSLTIPDSVTIIGEHAFESCSGLTSVTIPSSVTSLGQYAFSGCTSLINIVVNAYISNFGQVFFGLNNVGLSITFNYVGAIPDGACNGRSNLTSVTIGSNITSIGVSAFESCSGLTSLTIPDSVTIIGEQAFQSCYSLTSVTIPSSVTSIGQYAFSGCTSLINIVVNAYISNFGQVFFGLNNVGLSITFNYVGAIPDGACNGRSNLTSVTIGSNITSIGVSAFESCSGLTSVTIGSNITSIGVSAFQSCSGLTSVTIGNSVTSIGNNAFRSCSGLTSVTIPNSVTSIGASAFQSCSGLTSVTIGDSVTSIGSQAFRDCSGLTSVTIGASVTSIGASAFAYTLKLTDIFVDSNNNNFLSLDGVLFNKTITTLIKYPTWNSRISYTVPYTVITISERAFGLLNYSDNKLTSLILNDGLVSIQFAAFRFCLFTSIIIPSSVTSIGAGAFGGCSSLTSIIIPDSVTSIDFQAFYGCSSLTSVTIGDSVTSIGDSAFDNCNLLLSVTFNGAIPTISPNNFTVSGDTAYYYAGATNTSRLSPFFTNVILLAPQPAPVITSITTSSGTATINFTQTTIVASAIISYQYSTDSGTTWVTALQTSSPIVVTGLTNDASYNFAIRNYNGSYSTSSNIVNATILSIPQPAPVITIVITSSESATINFTQTTIVASAILSYQYSINGGSTWVTALQTSSPIIVTGLTNGTRYNFAIRNNNGLYSAASNTFEATVDTVSSAELIGTGELTPDFINSIIGITSSFVIQEGFTSISENTFAACVGDVNITLPSSVTNIGATNIQGDGIKIERTSWIVQWQSRQTTKLYSDSESKITAKTLFAQ